MDSPAATGSRRGIALPLAVVVFATLLLALCTVLATLVSIARLLDCGARRRGVERWTADVARLDEVLTMSANMAAATGDMRWRQRYHQHVLALDEAIAALRAVSPNLFDRELGADTDAANQRLIAIATLVLTIVAGAAWWSLATRVREAKVSSELVLARLQ